MIIAFACVRGLHLAGLMLLFGSAVLLLRLKARAPDLAVENAGLHRVRLAAALLALVSAPLWLALATAQMAGDVHAMIDPATLNVTLGQTLFGQMLAVRFVLLILAALMVALQRERLVLLFSGLALVLVSVTSHAAAASPAGFTAIGIISDALHLLCGGVWLGGLIVLAAILTRRPEAPRLHQALALFADRAMIAVALLVMTGLLNTATIVLGGEGHAALPYLGVLGAKLVLVLTMVSLAVINHFRLMPRLSDAGAQASLKGNIAWELGLGLLVVLLAGLLGLLPSTV